MKGTKAVSAALLLCCAVLLSSCAGLRPGETDETLPIRPVLLFWSGDNASLSEATYIVNTVWAGPAGKQPDTGESETEESEKNIRTHVSAWRERGVFPLDWAGGNCYVGKGPEALAGRWGLKLEDGHAGIAIDEMGRNSDEELETFSRALRKLKQEHPDSFIAIWHYGPLNSRYGAMYKEYADLVMIELYESAEFLDFFFDFRRYLRRARRHGISGKTVFALGVAPGRWLTRTEDVRERMEFIRDEFEETPGIAFFAPKIRGEKLRQIEEDAAEIFRPMDK